MSPKVDLQFCIPISKECVLVVSHPHQHLVLSTFEILWFYFILFICLWKARTILDVFVSVFNWFLTIFIILIVPLWQSRQTFPWKFQIISILGFLGHSLCVTAVLWWTASSYRCYVCGWAYLCSNKILFTKLAADWIWPGGWLLLYAFIVIMHSIPLIPWKNPNLFTLWLNI